MNINDLFQYRVCYLNPAVAEKREGYASFAGAICAMLSDDLGLLHPRAAQQPMLYSEILYYGKPLVTMAYDGNKQSFLLTVGTGFDHASRKALLGLNLLPESVLQFYSSIAVSPIVGDKRFSSLLAAAQRELVSDQCKHLLPCKLHIHGVDHGDSFKMEGFTIKNRMDYHLHLHSFEEAYTLLGWPRMLQLKTGMTDDFKPAFFSVTDKLSDKVLARGTAIYENTRKERTWTRFDLEGLPRQRMRRIVDSQTRLATEWYWSTYGTGMEGKDRVRVKELYFYRSSAPAIEHIATLDIAQMHPATFENTGNGRFLRSVVVESGASLYIQRHPYGGENLTQLDFSANQQFQLAAFAKEPPRLGPQFEKLAELMHTEPLIGSVSTSAEAPAGIVSRHPDFLKKLGTAICQSRILTHYGIERPEMDMRFELQARFAIKGKAVDTLPENLSCLVFRTNSAEIALTALKRMSDANFIPAGQQPNMQAVDLFDHFTYRVIATKFRHESGQLAVAVNMEAGYFEDNKIDLNKIFPSKLNTADRRTYYKCEYSPGPVDYRLHTKSTQKAAAVRKKGQSGKSHRHR